MNGNLYAIVLAVAALVLFRYIRQTQRPIQGSGFRILLPLVFMTPGFMLILNPQVHSPGWMWGAAVALGVTLSLPLIYTTGYERRENGAVYTKPNVWFIAAFVGVLAIRFALRSELDILDAQTKAALFMAVAFGYILPWRISSYIKYRRVLQLRGAQ